MMIFAVRSWKKQMEWNKRVRKMARRDIPEEVPFKTFKPKCSNLEIMEEYGEVLDDAYWDWWEKREYTGRTGPVSWVDVDKLKEEAERVWR